jgi:hypothetical protein
VTDDVGFAETLRAKDAEIERLREALERIATGWPGTSTDYERWAAETLAPPIQEKP